MYKYEYIHYTVGLQVRKKALAVFVLRACFNTTKHKYSLFSQSNYTLRGHILYVEGTMGSRFTCCVREMHDCETFGYTVHLIKFL